MEEEEEEEYWKCLTDYNLGGDRMPVLIITNLVSPMSPNC